MTRVHSWLFTLVRQYRLARGKKHGRGRSPRVEALLIALIGASISVRASRTPLNPCWWMIRAQKL